MKKHKLHIAISGNIGVGKTSLTQLISHQLGYQAFFEPLAQNPYMDLFYKDMSRWAFHVQMHFLMSRFKQQIEMDQLTVNIVQDRCMDEDAHIFAAALHQQNFLSDREFESYQMSFEILNAQVRKPDLMIYLKRDIPSLLSNIQKRNRSYETNIQVEYLELLQSRYEKWIKNYKGALITINLSEVDFVHTPADQKHILQLIQKHLE